MALLAPKRWFGFSACPVKLSVSETFTGSTALPGLRGPAVAGHHSARLGGSQDKQLSCFLRLDPLRYRGPKRSVVAYVIFANGGHTWI